MTKNESIKKYFNQAKKLKISNKNYLRQVKFLLDWFVKEDSFKKGDITSKILISDKAVGAAKILAKQDGVLAGLQEVAWLLNQHKLKFQVKLKDGQAVKNGQTILFLQGNLRKILLLERTLLNVLQRMSGIATTTARLVKKVGGKVLVCPTRKTQWGLLDKRAVVCGGGGTHRLGLYDFVLIKENHLKKSEITNHQSELKRRFWEVEVESKQQALQMAELDPSAIMFDDFTLAQIRTTIKQIKKVNSSTIFEASGGISEKNIKQYAKTGVDVVSLGALTHSVKVLDLSLEIL